MFGDDNFGLDKIHDFIAIGEDMIRAISRNRTGGQGLKRGFNLAFLGYRQLF